jgi:hypothetical protein
MSLATLLVIPDTDAGRNAFTFDHAMNHRNLLTVMGPLDQWSVLPYFIDPTSYDALPGTNWHLNHNQAHSDFITFLPANPDVLEAGMTINQNLLDEDFRQEGNRQWWTFNNHQEHLIPSNTIVTLDLTVPPSQIPWWALDPRLVFTAW